MSTLNSVAISSPIQFVDSLVSVRLADGTAVVLRPMQPKDVRRVVEMHDHLSADTIYFRYLHPYEPTFEEVESLAHLDGVNGATFVAVIKEAGDERVIGLGFYRTDAQDRTIAQPAFLVEDQFQNRGLGRALARLVIEHARQNGVRVFDALIHPANRRMMRVIQASGFSYEAKLGYGACEVRVSLQEPGRSEWSLNMG
jgi:RimJ/RimL family protein N-acetyltransferase